MRIFFVCVYCLLCFCRISAQPNDRCTLAIEIKAGQVFFDQNNERATTFEGETPKPIPVSCIETFENDLWYRFTATEEHRFYEIEITTTACNFPTGLQGLIIEAENCDSEQYVYKACANPHSEIPFKLYLENPVPGKNYFIYIDGFDGTECVFSVSLDGYKENPLSGQDYKSVENDFSQVEPSFFPEVYEVSFMNNETTIRWSASTEDDVLYFLIEGMLNVHSKSPYGRILGRVEPTHTVGSELEATYEFVDNKSFYSDLDYCYRIVWVNSAGEKAYSEIQCVKAHLIEDFHVSPVYPTEDAGMYKIILKNRKRQTLVFSILDEHQKELKKMIRKREPKQEGVISIDMKAYSPGIYFLKVEGKDAFYLRKFRLK